MKGDEKEEHDTGDTLNQIEPIAWIGVVQIIRSRFYCDHQPIDGVINERYKDAAGFYKDDVGNRLQILNRIVKVSGSGQRF